MRNLQLLILALGAALAFSACSSVNTVERASPEAVGAYIADKRVVTDPSLASKVGVVRVNEGRAADLLRIQVEVENSTYSDQTYMYQIVWIDQDGFKVNTPPAQWKAGQIKGRERQFISAVAPNPRVVDFLLTISEE